jgi:predicted acylesterase/phospholipase RssA
MLRKMFLMLSLAGLLPLASCTITARDFLPEGLENSANVSGVESNMVRIWGDADSKEIEAYITKRNERTAASGLLKREDQPSVENYLVLSGGGQNGAFGAGLLNGWTQTGKRPQFRIVTGVSTGSLIAPFAFLGSKYDPLIKEFYTTYSTKDIIRPTVAAGLFGGDSLTDSKPLASLIAKYITPKVLSEIATEYGKGRNLLIGTTNLDAGRPVIWNMGEIAAQGTSRGLDLFRSVVLASASIPGAFPPVLIDVNSNGLSGKEMHVDGGTTDNAIFLPFHANLKKVLDDPNHPPQRNLYIIINSSLTSKFEEVKASTFSIAGRSINTLIKQQTISDVQRIYEFANKNNMNFHLTGIPNDFSVKAKESFDKEYMGKLFNFGYNLAIDGYNWLDRPVGF